MATKHLVPRGDGEGGIGNSSRSWGEGHFKNLHCSRALSMPVTDTANRPSNPVIGTAVFDTDVGGLVIWNGTQWVEAGVPSPKTLLLSVDPVGAGDVAGGGTYDKNTDVAISATPNTHYAFSHWEGDVSEVRDINENPTLVKMNQSWTIVAKFSVAQYDLTVDSTTGGTATGAGTYDYGSNIQIEAIADTANGYEFVEWTGDGIDDPTSPITTVSIDGDKTVTANFALATYDLTIDTVTDPDLDGVYEIDTSGMVGTTTGAGTSIPYGTVRDITASVVGAESIYEFKGWEGTGVSDPNSASTTVTITSDLNLDAKFAPKTYTANVSVADFTYESTPETPGTVTVGTQNGERSGAGPYIHSDTVYLQATVDSSYSSKYEFSHWSGDTTALDDANSASAIISSIDSNVTLVANFKLIEYTVTVDAVINTPANATQPQLDAIANFSNVLSTSGSGSFAYGSSNLPVAFSFSSDSSIYSFSGWTETTSVVDSTLESTALSNQLSSDITVTANFSLATFNVSLSDEAVGSDTFEYTVTGDGTAYNFSGNVTGSNLTLPNDTDLFDVGDTIIITNNSHPNHPIAIEDSNGNIIATEQSGVLTHTFTLGGEYTYFCTAPGHRGAGMEGTINVQASGTFSGSGEHTYGSVVDIEYTPTPGILNSFTGTFTLEDDSVSSNYSIEYNVFTPDDVTLYGDGISDIFTICQAGNAKVISGPGVGGVGTYEIPKLDEPILLDGGRVQYGFVAWTGSDVSTLTTNTATTQISSINQDVDLVLDYGLPPISKLNIGLGPFYYGESLNISTASYDIDGTVVSETLDTGGLAQSQTGSYVSSHSLEFNLNQADKSLLEAQQNELRLGSKAIWPNTDIIQFNGDHFTIAMWVKLPPAVSPIRPFYIYLFDDPASGYKATFDIDTYNLHARPRFDFRQQIATQFTPNSRNMGLLPNVYNSIVCSVEKDGNDYTFKCYVNGELQYTDIKTGNGNSIGLRSINALACFDNLNLVNSSNSDIALDVINEVKFDQFAIYDSIIPSYDVKKMYGAGTPIDVTGYYMYKLRHLLEFNDPSNIYKDSINPSMIINESSGWDIYSNPPALLPIDSSDRPQQLFSVDLPLTDTTGNSQFDISVTAEDDEGLTSTSTYTLNLIQFPLVAPTVEPAKVLVEDSGQPILSAPVVFSAESEINVDGNIKTFTII